MAAPKVRADYDQMAAIARSFSEQSQATQATLRGLRERVEALRGGDWVGQGATAFYAEIDQAIFPALTRLVKALASAQSTAQQISQVMKTAEDEAAAFFRLQGSGQVGAAAGLGAVSAFGAGGVGGSAAAGAAGGGVSAGAAPAAGGSASGRAAAGATRAAAAPANPSQALVSRDPSTVFNEKYMNDIVGSKIPGANNKELNTAMERLMANPPAAERDRLLARIAAIRDRPLPELRAEFDKFQQLQRASRRKPDELDITSQWHDASDFPDHLGSTVSLRYGKVVGDVFGIDPVFGALLNPTGGIMGPGSSALPQPGPNDPLAFHSIFHDAGGYLINNHGIGPGYDYLGRESAYDPAHPLTGQKSGLRYWHGRMDSPGPDWIVENAKEGAMDSYIWASGGRKPRPRR